MPRLDKMFTSSFLSVTIKENLEQLIKAFIGPFLVISLTEFGTSKLILTIAHVVVFCK